QRERALRGRAGRRSWRRGALVAEERRQQRLEACERALRLRGVGRLLGYAPRRAGGGRLAGSGPGKGGGIEQGRGHANRQPSELGGLTRSASGHIRGSQSNLCANLARRCICWENMPMKAPSPTMAAAEFAGLEGV